MGLKQEFKTEDDLKKAEKIFGIRHLQIFLLACMTGISMGKNVNFSIGIVAMVDPKVNPLVPTYNWTDSNLIISSYYWLSFPCQIISGVLSEKYSSKWVIGTAAFFSSFFTIAIPLMAQVMGSWGVMICRIVQGSAQALYFPSAFNMMVHWIPVPERTKLFNVFFSGGNIGVIISMFLSGFICASSFGWPVVFYLSGTLGFVWLICWVYLGSDDPKDHPWISDKEKNYILSSHGKFVPEKNGILSALPYVVNLLIMIVGGFLFGYLCNQKIMSITNVRKLATSIGVFGPAVALIILGALGENANVVSIISLLVVAVALSSAICSGYMINNADISPNFAATISAMTNGGSILFCIIGPIAVQLIVTDIKNVQQWSIIFYITAALYVVAGLTYLVFGTAEVQPWNSGKTKKTKYEPT